MQLRSTLLLVLCFSLDCLPAPDTGEAARSGTADSKASHAPAATEAINVRGAPVQGATRRTEASFDITESQLAVRVGEFTVTGTMALKGRVTEDLEILEVRDGTITKGRLSYILDKSTTTMRLNLPDGAPEEDVSEENGPLHGRAEAIEFSGGRWIRTLEGAPATAELARLLSGPPIDDAMYPTSIKIGESWTESGPELRRWLGTDVLSAHGEVQSTLVAVETLGEKVAVIESIGEVTATMLDPDNHEMTMTLGIQGTTRRSLDRAVDLESSSAGALKLTGEVIEDGTPATMTVTGRYSATIRGSLR